MIRLTLSAPTPSLNETLRWHWARKKKAQDVMSWELQGSPDIRKILSSIPRASVSIVRHGSRLLDEDNLVGGVKGLVDVLKPPGKGNPYGLGIIAGDEPDKLRLTVTQVKCKRAEARTEVTVEEWSGDD